MKITCVCVCVLAGHILNISALTHKFTPDCRGNTVGLIIANVFIGKLS